MTPSSSVKSRDSVLHRDRLESVFFCVLVLVLSLFVVLVITSRLVKKIDSINQLHWFKRLLSDNLGSMLFTYFVFLSYENVNIHITISGTGIITGFYTSLMHLSQSFRSSLWQTSNTYKGAILWNALPEDLRRIVCDKIFSKIKRIIMP